MSDDECSEEEEDFLEHPNYKNDEPTEVRMLPYIFKVDRIDPITMTCFIHAEVALRWPDDRVIEAYTPKLRTSFGVSIGGEKFYKVKSTLVQDPDDPEDEGWDKIWKPNLVLDQIMDDDETGELSELAVCMCPKTKMPMLYMYRIYRNVVRVEMDLRDFPFDRQSLTFSFMLQDQPSTEAYLQLHQLSHLTDASKCLDKNVDGAADGYELMGCRFVPDICEEEWSEVMAKHDLLTEKEREGWTQTGGQARFSNFEIRFDVCRESYFYVSKIILVVYVLLLMEIATFFMAEDDIGTRSSVTLTLFLTAVAFQFATGADLPKLPYLTYNDKLMVFMYVMLFFAYVENMWVFRLVQSDGDGDGDALTTAANIDRAFCWTYLAVLGMSILILWVCRYRAQSSPDADFGALYYDTLETVDRGELAQLNAEALERLKAQQEPPPENAIAPHAHLPSAFRKSSGRSLSLPGGPGSDVTVDAADSSVKAI